ncbi:hypothetical protein AAC387_Pa02g1107 [Persea americana]
MGKRKLGAQTLSISPFPPVPKPRAPFILPVQPFLSILLQVLWLQPFLSIAISSSSSISQSQSQRREFPLFFLSIAISSSSSRSALCCCPEVGIPSSPSERRDEFSHRRYGAGAILGYPIDPISPLSIEAQKRINESPRFFHLHH